MTIVHPFCVPLTMDPNDLLAEFPEDYECSQDGETYHVRHITSGTRWVVEKKNGSWTRKEIL
jgi:hypothetical protein